MAITDIPEFVEVQPGDLIRAENWNNMQQQMRDSLRRHQHTRAPNVNPDDTTATDEAAQIGTNEIADGAVTAAKLAADALANVVVPDGAVTTAKLADGAVTTDKIAQHAVTTSRMAFATVNSGSVTIPPGGVSVDNLVQAAAPSTKTTIYFPLLTILNATQNTSPQDVAVVDAVIVYERVVGTNTIDVHIRLTNRGNATAGVFWQVLTFAS